MPASPVQVRALGGGHRHRRPDRPAALADQGAHPHVAADRHADDAALVDDAVEEQARAARTPRAGGEAADEGQAAQDVGRLLDEALDGEGVRVGEQEADLVGAGVLRHAADDEAGLGAARVEAERGQRRVRQRGRPDGDRGPRLDAPAVADHAAGAAADGHARPRHLHRPAPRRARSRRGRDGRRRRPGGRVADLPAERWPARRRPRRRPRGRLPGPARPRNPASSQYARCPAERGPATATSASSGVE